MSYIELYQIISRPWASIQEIMKVANCGRDSAIKIRNHIKDHIEAKGKSLPPGKTLVIPMKQLLEYLFLDPDYIMKMAEKEQLLNLILADRTESYAGISK